MASLMASSCSSNYQLISHDNPFNQGSSCGFDNPQLSTEKANRIAMLKTRFADLIFKAQRTLKINGESEDPDNMRPEKVGCVKKQHNKKKRGIESQVNNAKAAITNMPHSELKMKIIMDKDLANVKAEKEGINQVGMRHEEEDSIEKQQEKKRRTVVRVEAAKFTLDKKNYDQKVLKLKKEREAARLALEKVEASVYIDDFNQTYKEYMMLISSQSDGVK